MLGLVSLFMDTSSELVHSLLPIFMAAVLGTSMVTIGLIEGVAEAAAAISKVFSGALSDYFAKRKFLVVFGYALSAITKPVFPLAATIDWVFGARFVDRIGKGIRGAPRDALIADMVTPQQRGTAYGLRQSLDSAGAFLGPLLAVLFMSWLAGDIKAVLWIAVIPAILSVLVLIFAVHEPETDKSSSDSNSHLKLTDAKRLSLKFWLVVAFGAVFTLARFSEAFLILRAQDLGMEVSLVPVIMIVMNIGYALFAYPSGMAADRFSSRKLLVVGLVVLIMADLILALATTPWTALFGAALWGLHMALTQGLLAKLVADTASADLRGSAFGIFNLVSGLALLLASVVAGILWSEFGASATFIAGAVFAAITASGLLLYRRKV
ncbi:MAG: MFS transporter [Chromatiales bacterium]|jgi:MFS family permease